MLAEAPVRQKPARQKPAPPPAQPRPMAVVPAWVEAHCIVPDGFRKGRLFRLYDYQLRYLANYYTVRGDAPWTPDNPVLAPAFVYRRGLLVGPQKVGKNPLIASQVCVEGVGPALFAGWAEPGDGYSCAEHGCRCGWEYEYDPGEPTGMSWPTPLIQITAFSEESTDNTYDALRPMIDDGPLADLIPKTGEDFIRLPGGGRIDTVTSSAQSRLGQRVTFAPQDELGIWTVQNKMAKVADTQYRGLAGMGGRASLTTNAWDTSENSVAQQQFTSSAVDIYRQFAQPPKTLSYADKRERHKIHQIVYPADTRHENGGHVDLSAIENEAADLVERDLPQAMRFYGNIVTTGAGHALDSELWDSRASRRPIAPQTYIGLGFDGSVSRDWTVLRGCTGDGYSFLIGAWGRPPGAPPEWKVPRLEVHEKIRWAREYYRIGRFFYDPPKWWTEGETWAQEFGNGRDGKPIVLAFDTNQSARMAPAIDRWRTAIREGGHTHDADPVTDAHVKATHLQPVKVSADAGDSRTLYIFVKGADHRPIDASVADVLAYEAAMTMSPAPALTRRTRQMVGF